MVLLNGAQDDEVEKLQNNIIRLQLKLVQVFEEKGSLLDSTVLSISQELDQSIVRFQHLKGEEGQ